MTPEMHSRNSLQPIYAQPLFCAGPVMLGDGLMLTFVQAINLRWLACEQAIMMISVMLDGMCAGNKCDGGRRAD